MIRANDPRYRPLWLRVGLTAIALIWGGVEFVTGSPGFGIVFVALGLFAGWRLLWSYDPDAGDSVAAQPDPSEKE